MNTFPSLDYQSLRDQPLGSFLGTVLQPLGIAARSAFNLSQERVPTILEPYS